jgi:hypothetical protein
MKRPQWQMLGQEPDYRFTLANERTFLAWIRTALAVLAGGIVLDQFASHVESKAVLSCVALALSLLAAVMAGCAYSRWKGMRSRCVIPGPFRPRHPAAQCCDQLRSIGPYCRTGGQASVSRDPGAQPERTALRMETYSTFHTGQRCSTSARRRGGTFRRLVGGRLAGCRWRFGHVCCGVVSPSLAHARDGSALSPCGIDIHLSAPSYSLALHQSLFA